MLEEFTNNLSTFNEIDYVRTILSFFCCVIFSFGLKFLYHEKSNSISNKYQISNIIPILASVTFLVIVIVKSSLALSLGLVGALSIVRFRTPIKEPEELIYLFFAIALGLGFGAGQIIATSVITILIFILVWFFLSKNGSKVSLDYNLIISCNVQNKIKTNVSNDYIFQNMSSLFNEFDIIKYETDETGKVVFILKVLINDIKKLDELKEILSKDLNELKISFYYADPVY